MKSKDYIPFEKVSPYSVQNEKRLKNPKENFKKAAKYISHYLQKTDKVSSKVDLIDVGCANGEFLFFCNTVNPSINKYGLDMTSKFIDTAKSLSIPNTNYIVDDMFEYSKNNSNKYDIVTCFGTIPIFKDAKEILECLFQLLKPGGILIADGYFNKHDISVNIYFRDDSIAETKGIWRCDFNQHSYRDIRNLSKEFSDIIELEEIDFDVDIPKDNNAPKIHVWTEDLANGKKLITNGANLVVTPVMLKAIKR